MRNDVIHVRVSDDLKASVEKILDDLGITLSYAINMYLKQIEIKRGIPFEISLPAEKKSLEFTKNSAESEYVAKMHSISELNKYLHKQIEH